MHTLSKSYGAQSAFLPIFMLLMAVFMVMVSPKISHANNVGFTTMGIRLHETKPQSPQTKDSAPQNTSSKETSEAYMPHAGMAKVEHHGAENYGTIDVAIWYPTIRAPQTITMDRWQFQAARNAKPIEGRFPLVIISHGMGESRFYYHSLATYLAQNGFVVAALTHPHDCDTDMSAIFTLQQLVHRPQHISHLIDTILSNSNTSSMIDAQRISFIGFDIGATTALMLAGAIPSPTAWQDYCTKASPNDVYCSPWAKKRLDNMALALADALYVPENITEKTSASAGKSDKKNPSTQDSQASILYPKMPPLHDKRIKSFTLITPAYGMFFPASALKKVTAPILLVQAGYDAINQRPFHAESLRVNLPITPEFFHLKEAGHFSLRDMPNLAPRHGNMRNSTSLHSTHKLFDMDDVPVVGDIENTAGLEPTLSADKKVATQKYVHNRILIFVSNTLRP